MKYWKKQYCEGIGETLYYKIEKEKYFEFGSESKTHGV